MLGFLVLPPPSSNTFTEKKTVLYLFTKQVTVGKTGLIQLFQKALNRNSSLHSINISNNHLDSEGIKCFVTSILNRDLTSSASAICDLNVGRNSFGDTGFFF